MPFLVVIRGGGDLASGVILRLARAGIIIVVTELPQPLAVRRSVSFAQAIYSQKIEIEGVRAQYARTLEDLPAIFNAGIVPVLVDPQASCVHTLQPLVVVDGRMRKRPPETPFPNGYFSIGLGPGFIAGENCDAAVETKRGHFLGRVYWQGSPEPDSGIPEPVENKEGERVIRAPQTGKLETLVEIGNSVLLGTPLARVGQATVSAQFAGIIRGMMMGGLNVIQGMKIGDLDPRDDPNYCQLVSDKALAVGGGVLEAILSRTDFRKMLW